MSLLPCPPAPSPATADRLPAAAADDPTLPGVWPGLAPAAARTLMLAAQAIGLSDPNPRVGCVLLGPGGEWLGEGHTQAAGGPHAEIMALRAAQAAGHRLQGASAWVSLEPCSHHGRTPPCCDALVAAGLAEVHVAVQDPNPRVAGEGLARLRAAGLAVHLHGGAWGEAAQGLNPGFFARMQHGRPWVRMKVATSLDGRTALDDGRSQWITGAEARHDAQAWRRRAGAILSGIGTVLRDDPRLDVRGWPCPRPPWRVVVDARLDTPPQARLFEAAGPLLLACAFDPDAPPGPDAAARVAALRARGATVWGLPGADGTRVDLAALVARLAAELEVNELHAEAGARLNGALLGAGLVDELLVYLAPRLLGPGRALAELPVLDGLDAALALDFHAARPVGPDLRLLARPRR